MVKTEEAAHGRRVEKRRVEGAGVGSAQDVHSAVPWRVGRAGGGVVLVPHAGWLLWFEGRQIPNMTVQVCCISNCPRSRMYQMCRR